MDSEGVDRIAAALKLHWVYYPASIKMGRDWGNAILSRWPLSEDRKLLLPHGDPYSNTRRIAVAAQADVGGRPVLVYSTHIATPSLGLGARLDQIQNIVDDAAGATGRGDRRRLQHRRSRQQRPGAGDHARRALRLGQRARQGQRQPPRLQDHAGLSCLPGIWRHRPAAPSVATPAATINRSGSSSRRREEARHSCWPFWSFSRSGPTAAPATRTAWAPPPSTPARGRKAWRSMPWCSNTAGITFRCPWWSSVTAAA